MDTALIVVIVIATILSLVTAQNPDWENNLLKQYHVQTDEGPNRWFRYETLSGQYRREKRLDDGTVIGSYAWLDQNGVLRQKDYIADNEGYRITKSKHTFVGQNLPISEAMSKAKKIIAAEDLAAKNQRSRFRTTPFTRVSTTALPPAEIVVTPRPLQEAPADISRIQSPQRVDYDPPSNNIYDYDRTKDYNYRQTYDRGQVLGFVDKFGIRRFLYYI